MRRSTSARRPFSGFALYQFGKIEFPAQGEMSSDSVDIKGYAIDLRADANPGPRQGVPRGGLYISGSKMSGDNPDYEGIITFSDFDASPGGNSAFGRTDMSILLVNADDINCAQAFVGAAASPTGTAPARRSAAGASRTSRPASP